ncbi:MAG: aminomethyl-transferring glycine dehydrogenase subunit GcvPB [Candidatus Neomarinimicrobiota bacterium]
MEKILIIDKSASGRVGINLPPVDVPETDPTTIFADRYFRRSEPRLPEVSEPEVARHYIGLSTKNHHVDKDFYPLGSCTMKYNPKINDAVAALPGFAGIHPAQPEETVQGALQLLWELEQQLKAVTGMSRFTLQPSAGAQGELVGVFIMKKYHEKRGNSGKTHILIPDSAHGTNPASVAIGGFQTRQVKSGPDGLVDIEDLKANLDDSVAGMMLTQPNTLGLFESNICEITELIHSVDGLMYMDGANLNALIGIVRPLDMGFDIVHINLHKTFSTPHGGGGPGAGPIGVVEQLVPYLPVPRVEKSGADYRLNYDGPDSLGRIHGFYGNFGVLVRAYTFIKSMGEKGLRDMTRNAIVNANYLMRCLNGKYEVAYPGHCMHEFVITARGQKERGGRALDIAKRLLDHGFHAPTIYFPISVPEAMMIEPTESESRETLDRFAATMLAIDEEIDRDPNILLQAPTKTPVRRLDETTANRNPNLRWS